MLNNDKNANLSYKKDEKSSPFVVDLRLENRKQKTENSQIFVKKTSFIEFKKIIYFFRICFIGILRAFKKFFGFFSWSKFRFNVWKNLKSVQVKELFLIKIFKAIYRLCIKLGFGIIFIIRFVSILFYRIFEYLFSIFSLKSFLNIVRKDFLKIVNKFESKKFRSEIVEKNSLKQTSLKIKFAHPKRAVYFIIVLLIFILPLAALNYYQNLGELKGKVLGTTASAFDNLKGASASVKDLDFDSASNNFSLASENFFTAQKDLAEINGLLFSLASLSSNKEIKLASYSKDILAAGENASSLGENLSLSLSKIFESEEKNIPEIIDNFILYAKRAAKNAKELDKNLEGIDTSVLPEEYQEQFILLKTKAGSLESGLLDVVEIVEKLKEFVGATQNKRYLLVFQNNTEMRASGGFIGSFALVDFSKGKIKNIEVPGGGSYDTKAGMKEFIVAPEPLQLVDSRWNFWDANWWPDWAKSAQKLMWFYEKSDGPTVDGVISFTPTVLEKLLEVTGPIDMSEKYGVIINADNFWEQTQRIVEKKPAWREDGEDLNAEGERLEPKKIIGDLMQKIIDELPKNLNQESFIKIVGSIEESLSEKHVMFYFTDEDLQNEMENRDWAGRLKETTRDYLMVVNTNIAGAKTDKVVKEEIEHQSEIMPNGTIINTLKIKRTHTGVRGQAFTGVRNVDWMRIYVPEGSELMESQGFIKPDDIYFEEPESDWKYDEDVYREEIKSQIHENSNTRIYDESGKTVFANWSMVDPGESITIYLKYKLPFSLEKQEDDNWWQKIINPAKEELYPYSLLFQKQPGSVNTEIETNLDLASNFQIAWKYPKDLSLLTKGWRENVKLNIDQYFAVLLRKE